MNAQSDNPLQPSPPPVDESTKVEFTEQERIEQVQRLETEKESAENRAKEYEEKFTEQKNLAVSLEGQLLEQRDKKPEPENPTPPVDSSGASASPDTAPTDAPAPTAPPQVAIDHVINALDLAVQAIKDFLGARSG